MQIVRDIQARWNFSTKTGSVTFLGQGGEGFGGMGVSSLEEINQLKMLVKDAAVQYDVTTGEIVINGGGAQIVASDLT